MKQRNKDFQGKDKDKGTAIKRKHAQKKDRKYQ